MPYGRRGGEFVVNKQLVGIQYAPAVAGFASGGFIVVWETFDMLQDGAGRAVKAQRYDSLGNAVGPEMLINSAAAGDQRAPSVTTLASGGFVVTWETTDTTQDGSGRAIKGQLFDSSGAPVGAEFRINTQGVADQTKSSVTGLQGGGFLVSWQTADSTQDGHSSAIKAQIYNSAGVAVGGEFLVNTGAVGDESAPNVASLSGGGFVATWVLGSGANADIYAQVFDSSGAKTGGQFRVNSTVPNNQSAPTVTEISGGRFVVTWSSWSSLTTGDVEIRARIFSSNGTPVGTDFVVNTTRLQPDFGHMVPATNPIVEDLPNGGFVITWTHSDGNYLWSAIRGQFFDSSGNRSGTEVLVSTVTDRFEGQGDVAVDGNGMLLAVWSSANQSNQNDDIRGQLYSTSGAPEIVSNGGADLGSVTVAENQNAVTTVSAADPDGSGTLVYSIVGGLDASFFAINASTGVLTFVSAPNFEARWDFNNNNVYDVVVSVSDGVNSDIQALTVTVANVNEAPTISSSNPSEYFHRENGTAVATFSATDPDGTAPTWSIAGGPDADRFAIDPVTGALRFLAAPNFEAPTDAGANNFYNVTIAASDGSLTATKALTIEIANLPEGPVIVSGGGGDTASYSVAENTSFVTRILADDPDTQDSTYSFSIAGGADAALFVINATTGNLSFKSSAGANFEAPGDAGGNNVYDVIVAVSDGFAPADTQALSITVTDANDAPIITSNGGESSAFLSLPENQLVVTTVTATDLENAVLTYAISGGVDAALFTIDGQTGLLSFVSAPNREAPHDSGANNNYNVIVTVSDGAKSDSQALSISILDSNEAPVIVSNGGGGTATVQVTEGSLEAATVAATDPEGKIVSYAISGGADASRFTINSATGALSFLAAPDREQPADSDGDNLYEIVVSASDGVMTDSQTLSIVVGNVNEGVTVTSAPNASVAENGTAVMTVTAQDGDGDPVSFAISGGADSALFAVDASTGELRFLAAPNFEAPADSDGDNVYEVEVSASDGTLSGSKSISVTVTNQNEALAFVSGGGGEQAAVTIDENSGNVLALLAVDSDGTAPSYGIAGGADAALFELDPVTNALRFKALPDHEIPADADGDNVYEIVVGATDGQYFDYQSVSVTVANVYEGVSFAGPASAFSVDEETAAIGAVSARGEAGAAIVYAIAGGADANRFDIDPTTGALSWVAGPDHEAPGDSDGDNVYDLVVSASDGTASATQAVSITVEDVFEPVEIVSYGAADTVSLTVDEGYWMIGAVVQAVDEEGSGTFDRVVYSITGGADAALFTIDPDGGALHFTYDGRPDFEAPGDADGDNVYHVVVTASTSTSSDSQAFAITIANSNEGIFITSDGGDISAEVSIDEGQRHVTIVAADDPDGSPVTYSITGGPDASRFTIDALTGALSLIDAPDYEAPTDSGADNVYQVIVSASDGELSDEQTVHVSIDNVDEPVELVSHGGAAAVALTMAENLFEVTVVEARDEDGQPVTYAISGADADAFEIDPDTGALSFRGPDAPDFEDPASVDGDNVYDVTVTASSSTSSAAQDFSVTIVDVNEAPRILSYGLTSANEGDPAVTSVVACDPEGDVITYSIVGGADAALFEIDAETGLLTFIDAPDYEAPLSAAGTNVYTVHVGAGDGQAMNWEAFQVRVENVSEPVVILSYGGATTVAMDLIEGSFAVGTVEAHDEDGTAVTYRITGGADAARFRIDSLTGALSFAEPDAPNFENPTDSNRDNLYSVVVTASSTDWSKNQVFLVSITNRDEAVSITSNGGGASASVAVAENGTAVTFVTAGDPDFGPVTYAIAGGADAARFTIDASTGALAFVSAPNFEAPADSDGDNVYDVIVSATDGSFTDSQAVAVTVVNYAETVTIVSNGGGDGASVAVAENGISVSTVVTSGFASGPVTYAIAGGADAARFAIDPSTGVLTFLAPPNFEAPADAGANNVYDVVVSASNGETVDTQALAVTVGNVNEPVTISSNGGGSTASVALAENGTAVTIVTASDADGGAVTYAISGGADASRFTIDASTGALAFVSAPNFEAPGDAGGNNVYDVIVSASDGSFVDTQAIAVTVGNVNEPVTISSNGGGSTAALAVAENGTAVTTVAASDGDGGAVTYAIAGGADASRFIIDASTGVLAFVSAPNFEAPADAGGNNVYDVIVSASDGSLVDTQAIAVTVGNVNEGPVITSSGGGASGSVSVTENGLAVVTVASTDPEGTARTYSIVGGADSARFTINAQTGALQFVAAPDWELPADSNLDNVYSVVVRASDGQLFDEQALSVTVVNTPDGNNVTGTSGSDSISATSLNLALRTSNEEDVVFGRDGHDNIQGMAGDDDLYGEGGNDVLIGGAGADRLTGGLGKDQYTYNSVSESTVAARDSIQDFNRGQGDKISLSAIDANTVLSNNQAFTFIGTAAFSAAGQLRYETAGGITTISGDVNGDGVADLVIQLSGSIALISSDFIL